MNTTPVESFPVHRLRWLARMRLLGLLGAAILVLLAAWQVPGLASGQLLFTLAMLAAIDLAVLSYLSRGSESELAPQTRAALMYGQIIVDILGLTILLHFAGGAENPFFPFYVFAVMLAATLLQRPAVYGFAAMSSLVYVSLLAAEAVGLLPHYHLADMRDPQAYQQTVTLLGQGLALAGTCFLAGSATTAVVGKLRTRAAELAESHRRAEVRAAHMRELNEQLRSANEECRHSREHLDALYLELQQAYNRLEIRSQNTSELNEQLRAANAEGRSRREELVQVHSKLQDAYQRLESRTEHMHGLNEQLRLANEDCRSKRDELTRLNEQLAYANNKLRELDDARSQFTLLVTHELRAPVAAIQSYLKLILEGYVPQEKVRETLEKAERRALEQLALISDLLELGRIQAAEARGQMGAVQIEKALLEQVDMMAGRAEEHSIMLHVDVEPDLPPVVSNPDQIRSVWNNLISNALKYTLDGGHVEISLRRDENRLVGSITDDGIGIPKEAMVHLFSEFFRADNAKAVSRMGTGLGLSIVKEIIERSGGRITAESELGKGTTFRFWLPITSTPPVAATPVGPPNQLAA